MTVEDYRKEFGSFYAQHLYFDLLTGEMSTKVALRLVPRVFAHMYSEEKITWMAMLTRIDSDTVARLMPRLR